MVSLGVVGHVAVDRIISANGVRYQLGGPPTYISLITHMLGYPLVAATRVGWDFPKGYASELALRGVEVYVDWAEKTTRFVLDYTKTDRGLGYDSLCSNITPSEVKDLPDTCILAPIVEEIPKETLLALGSRTLALDPQGFVRKMLPNGLICLRRWHDETLLRRLSVFKASTRELRLVVGESGWGGLEKLSRLGVPVAIETLGGEGANILSSGKRIVAPAFRGETIDPTGAGDAFIAGFMTEYASGEDVEWCAAVGSAAASAVVETVGPVIKIGKEALLKRAENLRFSLKILS